MKLDGIPLGHSIMAHHLFGWCCDCPFMTVADELNAWRLWAVTHPDAVNGAAPEGVSGLPLT